MCGPCLSSISSLFSDCSITCQRCQSVMLSFHHFLSVKASCLFCVLIILAWRVLFEKKNLKKLGRRFPNQSPPLEVMLHLQFLWSCLFSYDAVEFRLHPSSIMTLKFFLLNTDEVGRVFHHCGFDFLGKTLFIFMTGIVAFL